MANAVHCSLLIVASLVVLAAPFSIHHKCGTKSMSFGHNILVLSRMQSQLTSLRTCCPRPTTLLRVVGGSDTTNENPRTRGFLLRRFTGDSTPYKFPVRPVQLVKEWPEVAPFSAEDFSRLDPTTDKAFYAVPRLLYHIDEPAVAALTQFYRHNIPPGSEILDICSSWVSHYPTEFPKTMQRICGTGMSALELQINDQLTEGYKTVDLNGTPQLPYPDKSFDVVTCVVSIDYLIHPIQVLREVHRVLRPGGKVIVSQSNRCFPTKAIQMWLRMNDRQHLELINAYFQYAGGYQKRQAYDITADVPGGAYRDPMFVVVAIKEPET